MSAAALAFTIRPFEESDAAAVSVLMKKNFLEINSQDYPENQMLDLAKHYTPLKLLEQTKTTNTYVAEVGDTIIGAAGISPYYNSLTESILLSFFVSPDYHGKGIGTALFQTIENDPFYSRATRIEVAASRTARGFYERLGFQLKNPAHPENELGYIQMEKQKSLVRK
ncbi:GNAT family N-acetyltransferase [Enterococcus sp. LJL128]